MSEGASLKELTSVVEERAQLGMVAVNLASLQAQVDTHIKKYEAKELNSIVTYLKEDVGLVDKEMDKLDNKILGWCKSWTELKK